jgi:hypothetical protein
MATPPQHPAAALTAAPTTVATDAGPTETKAAFKTTEPIAYVVAVVGFLIAALVVDAADAGGFGAKYAWLYVTILTVGYMVSCGLAKSGRGRHRRGSVPAHQLCAHPPAREGEPADELQSQASRARVSLRAGVAPPQGVLAHAPAADGRVIAAIRTSCR